jgi:hypothetical protein
MGERGRGTFVGGTARTQVQRNVLSESNLNDGYKDARRQYARRTAGKVFAVASLARYDVRQRILPSMLPVRKVASPLANTAVPSVRATQKTSTRPARGAGIGDRVRLN